MAKLPIITFFSLQNFQACFCSFLVSQSESEQLSESLDLSLITISHFNAVLYISFASSLVNIPDSVSLFTFNSILLTDRVHLSGAVWISMSPS